MRSEIDLNNLAIKLRKKWDEDEYSNIDVFHLAFLDENMTIITMIMPSGMSGMCIKSNKEIIIAVNSSMSVGRQRFTLAHELYHAYYDDSMMTFVCMQNLGVKKTESEKEADRFASFLLAPYSALDRYESNEGEAGWNIEKIVRAEHFFGISHQAMLVRLFSEGRISQSEYNEYKETQVTTIAGKLGLPLDLYQNLSRSRPYSCSGSYLRKIQEAYDKELISEGKMKELLNDGFADYYNEIGDLIDD